MLMSPTTNIRGDYEYTSQEVELSQLNAIFTQARENGWDIDSQAPGVVFVERRHRTYKIPHINGQKNDAGEFLEFSDVHEYFDVQITKSLVIVFRRRLTPLTPPLSLQR